MSKGCFITGTDTGVGKTVVTAALATILREQGLRVGVMKLVETGCLWVGDSLLPQDAMFLRAASACRAPEKVIVPYVFAEPVAPALAAEIAGVMISMDHIRSCYQQLYVEHDIVLVEGAGGLLVPLSDQLTMHDVAVALDLPLLIIARNALGTINHTALTVAVAHERSRVLGVVLNHTQPPDPLDPAVQTNAVSLLRWAQVSRFCQLPHVTLLTPETLSSLGRLLLKHQMLEGIDL